MSSGNVHVLITGLVLTTSFATDATDHLFRCGHSTMDPSVISKGTPYIAEAQAKDASSGTLVSSQYRLRGPIRSHSSITPLNQPTNQPTNQPSTLTVIP